MLIAGAGKTLLSFDLAQAEAWIVAYLANDFNMKDALKNSDIHKLTASVIFDKLLAEITKNERYIGKRCNHALNYRMGPFQMATTINKDSDKEPYVTVSNSEAKRWRDKYHEFYNIKTWWAEIEDDLRRSRTLTTPYGFQRTFYNRWDDDLFKEATAFIPQSTVGDHMIGAVQEGLDVKGGILEV